MILSLSLCTISAFIYVLSLYLVPKEIRKRSRDDREHIIHRMRMSTASTLFSIALVVYTLNSKFQSADYSIGQRLGFDRDTLVPATLATILLMCCFYIGPLIVYIIVIYWKGIMEIDSLGRHKKLRKQPWTFFNPEVSNETCLEWLTSGMIRRMRFFEDRMKECFNEIDKFIIFRNLIYAPISEEIVFRGLMIPVLHAAFITGTKHFEEGRQWHPWDIAKFSPIVFSIAHLHHIYEKIRHGESFTNALRDRVFQLTYTGIFGYFASLLFIYSGNIIAPIISHMICNFVGIPNITFMFQPGYDGATEFSVLYPVRHIILILHLTGITAVWFCIFPVMSRFGLVASSPFT